MPDDDVMDRLLREAMAADVPQLSPGFDARLMRRVRPPRLTPMGRALIAVYIVFALVMSAWVMRGLPLEWIATAVAIGVPAAACAGVYGRRLAGVH